VDSLDFCRDVDAECGATVFAQGAPWIVHRFRNPLPGRVEWRTYSPGGGDPSVAFYEIRPGQREIVISVLHSMEVRIRQEGDQRVTEVRLPSVGTHRVRVLRGGNVVAEATYEITRQSPREAWDAWKDAQGGWRAIGAALAAWRMGDVPRVEATLDRIARSPTERDRFLAASFRHDVSLALGRWADAARAAREMIAMFDQPAHRVLLIRALLRDCGTLDEAYREIRAAMRAFMGLPIWPRLLVELFEARARCAT
jgi:predicted Zn-dependent protease